MSLDEDNDLPQLSASTFAALQEFYKELEERELKQNDCKLTNTDVTFEEDWQLSQFWYDDKTVEDLAKLTLKIVGSNSKVALVSCPTLYKKVKEFLGPNSEVSLYEYDQRFAAYGDDFIFYDYKSPLNVPRERNSYYDIVIADPPFLSDECLTKTAVTIKFLAKEKIILCTGAIMADLAKRLLDLKQSKFIPRHRNNLANEFWCFTNFNIDDYL
ncbi:hypothetical protein GWI33_006685 [Rhynchophorus ferrugineus]|uniref:Protein-lysine N-methyltransferase GWI33_006685 n=1 Tax=Rhynchophorus ferrugineus TaxID=354439 RepID=A0A834IEJ4_RHYFE|nr:hypothetical protein GWI33_006685 [Rhynchophorus ferrugineus]